MLVLGRRGIPGRLGKGRLLGLRVWSGWPSGVWLGLAVLACWGLARSGRQTRTLFPKVGTLLSHALHPSSDVGLVAKVPGYKAIIPQLASLESVTDLGEGAPAGDLVEQLFRATEELGCTRL